MTSNISEWFLGFECSVKIDINRAPRLEYSNDQRLSI